jgi:hypothetical protein
MNAVALAGIIVGISFIVGLVFGAILILALPAARESFRHQLPGHGDGPPSPPADGNSDLGEARPQWPGETGYTDGHLG